MIDKFYNKEQYKLKYKFLTDRKIPKGFEVHHIDINRSNNHISNLVLLPIPLHRKYHAIRERILSFKRCVPFDGIVFDMKLFNPEQIELDPYNNIKLFQDLYDIMEICNNWVYLRDVILGVVEWNKLESTDYEFVYENLKDFNTNRNDN